MEIIRALFLPGEKVLWHKVMSKDSTNERNYVVTNRRIYKKHYKVAQSDFSEFPEHVVKVLGDILIIERTGIKIIRSAHKLSLFLETDFEDQLYRFYPFEKLNKYEAEEIKTILLDIDNLMYEEDIPVQQQAYQQSPYVQNGTMAYGYQEEKKKREVLEHKVRYLNDKILELNQNILFQKNLAEQSKKQLELKSRQQAGSQAQAFELNQKSREIEALKSKIQETNYIAQQNMTQKNKEIETLKQNIAKLIRIHSAEKPKKAVLLPEDINRERIKIERRKQKLKQDRIKLMKQRVKLMEKVRSRRESQTSKSMSPPIQPCLEQPRIPNPAPPPIQPRLEQPRIPNPAPPPIQPRLEQPRIPNPAPPPINIQVSNKNPKSNVESDISGSPSFSSELKKELNNLISHVKNVSSSLEKDSTDLTDELYGISNQLMRERERLIRELEVERDSLEELSQSESLPPITIISTNPTRIEKKADQSRMVKVSHGRRTCPVCGNQDKYPIKEVDDKENIIRFNPKIYGKKYICGDCMAEWRQGSAQ